MRLKNKSALITGGTSGIGLATAKLFIAEGARVAVTGRNDAVFEQVKAELGEHALVLKGDVRSIEDMRRIAAEVKEKFGGLDVVFANAGRAFPSAINDIEEELYNEIMDINVKGVVFTLQAVLPDLREGASFILNTSFVAQTGKHNISLTAAAKAAVRSLARSWSFEFGLPGCCRGQRLYGSGLALDLLAVNSLFLGGALLCQSIALEDLGSRWLSMAGWSFVGF